MEELVFEAFIVEENDIFETGFKNTEDMAVKIA
jgi:hypothetical protein